MASLGERNKKMGLFSRIANLSAVMQLILINIVVYLVLTIWSLFLDESQQERLLAAVALNPSLILHGQNIWTLLTHMFSHVLFFHLLLNMIALFSLGFLCERIIGRRRFVWFYLIAGVFAGLLSVLASGLFGNSYWGALIVGSPDVYMLGASGAIFAIAGLFVVLLPKLRFSIIFFPFITFPAYVIVPLILVLTWVVSIVSGLPIGNVAHFGGFIAGLFYGYYLRSRYPKKIKLLQGMFR